MRGQMPFGASRQSQRDSVAVVPVGRGAALYPSQWPRPPAAQPARPHLAVSLFAWGPAPAARSSAARDQRSDCRRRRRPRRPLRGNSRNQGAVRYCSAEHPLCPHSAASKYSRSASSSSFANSIHRLAMSSSRRLLSSFMVFESCKQAAALFLYSRSAVTICTPLVSCGRADNHLATI
jgi:hypothetical protein